MVIIGIVCLMSFWFFLDEVERAPLIEDDEEL